MSEDAVTSITCQCGGKPSPAQRVEADQTVDVRICWTCGAEEPPLYPRTQRQRDGDPFDLEAVCEECEQPFCQSRRHRSDLCGLACSTRRALRAQRRSV